MSFSQISCHIDLLSRPTMFLVRNEAVTSLEPETESTSLSLQVNLTTGK